MIEFSTFPKIPRLSRDCIITEKIDGTNAQIYIAENCEPITCNSGRVIPFLCGSRTRWIFPENDNHGFAKWAYENSEEILKLGPGRHSGEWWGKGLQRGYRLNERRFSLFNVTRWDENMFNRFRIGEWERLNSKEQKPEFKPPPNCCHVVPILWVGMFDTHYIETVLNVLKKTGSIASPGFNQPEGIVIYHVQGNCLFKKTILKDDEPKDRKQNMNKEIL